MRESSYDVDTILASAQSVPPSRLPIILWLVALGLLVMFVPLYLAATAVRADTQRLEGELGELQFAGASQPATEPTAAALQTRVVEVQSNVDRLGAVQGSLGAQQVDWPAVVDAIKTDTNQITLLSVEQAENRLTISGEAANDTAVIAYAQELEASGEFERVVVQSISLLPTPVPVLTPTTTVPTPTPTATVPPTAAATATSSGPVVVPTAVPTITPTPDYRDAYEVDDVQAKPIFIGEVQTHNFFPLYDVDNAYFLAKNGRYYTIATTNLSPGVDTVLTVTIGDQVYSNDDRQDGTLASEISVQSLGGDVQVFIQVTNRGQYGPEMAYQLFVQEVVPTAAPTSPPPATPTNTPPLPTALPTPSNTPDLRDQYEPDETTPATILVGETQAHNFFPGGDTDQVTFVTKGGRFYQVATSGLALGVDTFLRVQSGDKTWENDDYAPPGTGNFASAVCFPETSVDGTAVAHISNNMQQFAPDATYTIGVLEVPAFNLNLEQLAFGPIASGSENPPPQSLQVSGDNTLNWTAVTDVPWLQISPSQGGANSLVNVTANISGLPPGSYEGKITFSWASLCRREVRVTLQVDPAPPSSETDAIGAPAWVMAPHGQTAVSRRPFTAKQAGQPLPNTVSFVIIAELKTR
ncbi:MAG: hypothetical protein KC441_04710 [Anaerolineales bacterium]|nr:hypothetical protein [Anaerolineales bacterium]